jgi:16S rRNA (guanine527-N7)-methyltransferase
MEIAEDLLRKGLSELKISCSDEQIKSFLIYLAELQKWNRSHNLTGLKSEREIVIKHFLDSLLFLKVFPPDVNSIADIGSGAGFPGVPIKIVRPDLNLTLVEPAFKKAEFLRHICRRLGLRGIEVLARKIEEIGGLQFDVAVTRALFSIADFITKTEPILKENGIAILTKGPKINEEIEASQIKNVSILDLNLPFENITRHLAVVKKS